MYAAVFVTSKPGQPPDTRCSHIILDGPRVSLCIHGPASQIVAPCTREAAERSIRKTHELLLSQKCDHVLVEVDR